MRVPKGHVDLANKLHAKLPDGSALKKIPKEMLSTTWQAPAVCSHGVRTQNSVRSAISQSRTHVHALRRTRTQKSRSPLSKCAQAEQGNHLFKDVRERKSLLQSILTSVLQDTARQRRLRETLEQSKRVATCKQSQGTLDHSGWPAGSFTPSMTDELRAANSRLANLGSIAQIEQRADGTSRWEVQRVVHSQTPAGLPSHWVVDTLAVKRGEWADACTCGRTASRETLCDHVLKVVGGGGLRECVSDYLKPWQTVQSWENQVCRIRTADITTAPHANR